MVFGVYWLFMLNFCVDSSFNVCFSCKGLTRKSKTTKRRKKRRTSRRRATVSGRALPWQWGKSHPPKNWRRWRAGSRLTWKTQARLWPMTPRRTRARKGTRRRLSPSLWAFHWNWPPGGGGVRKRILPAMLTCRTPRIQQPLSRGRPAPKSNWPASAGWAEELCPTLRGRGLNSSRVTCLPSVMRMKTWTKYLPVFEAQILDKTGVIANCCWAAVL